MLYLSIALIAFAYVLGSVPCGLLIGRAFYHVDVREHGSGNIGATNCYRTLGKTAGISVFLADLLKGFIPVIIVKFALAGQPETMPLVAVIAGLAAMLGHSFSLFLKFSGGKGMSTAAGFILALWPWALPILLSAWALIIALTRYVSVASIIIAILLPFLVWILYPKPVYIYFAMVATVIAVYRHRSNISRLLAGTELKMGRSAK